MKTLHIHFTNRAGQQLAARLELPVGGHPIAFALFAHCFTCGKNLSAIGNISRALTQNGIAVLRFDFTGLGESEGDFADTTFSSNVDDLVRAAEFLGQEYSLPQIIIGHSLGGAAAILAAERLPSIRAVVTIGTPADDTYVRRLLHTSIANMRETGLAQVSIGGRSFSLSQQFIDDIGPDRIGSVVKNFGRALLIMHSPQDEVIGIANAAQLYDTARHPKSFITLDGADHLLSQPKDSLYAGTVIAAWASRYIDISAKQQLVSDKRVATRTGEAGYTTEIRAGNHSLLADEPESVGGLDLGPTPYDLLTAALGACTGMTLRMYADHKKWNLNEVKVHLTHSKDYVKDSGHPMEEGSQIDHIERLIEVDGDLDESQRARLLEIADKCPVHRTLHSEIRIRTALRDEKRSGREME
jgi:uncharacterized OsmC-like protein/pimeloyl-ACP methyl ester carboxylesterase